MMRGKIILKRGKEKPLINHHPWVFSGAIDKVVDAASGDIVDICDARGKWLARASYNEHSQIAARVWTFCEEEAIDREFFERRLAESIMRRDKAVIGSDANSASGACRLVNAESDGLPGLVVDKYGDFLVAQFLTLGIESHKKEVADLLLDLANPGGIYERSDVEVRKLEGLPCVEGTLRGEEPPDHIEIIENGLRFLVDVKKGHKTGFYLDQRENRRRAAPFLDGEVLNAFAYTGAFGVYAAQANNTKVLNLDTSADSLKLAAENFELNGSSPVAEFVIGDAFQVLRQFREKSRQFDGIVLDPPKFVSSRGQMERGLRGYKDINLLAFELLSPGGVLVTFSCSGLVPAELFQKVVFGALRDAEREGQIVAKLTQAADHPILLTFPEAEYLNGLIVKVW
jgi:23S rRNA (cytosine1962-C5)-methyltransferase